jgi:hypothetical protein
MLALLLFAWLVATSIGITIGYLMYAGVDKVVAGNTTRPATASGPGASSTR